MAHVSGKLNKIREYGVRQSSIIIARRIREMYLARYWRKKVLAQPVHTIAHDTYYWHGDFIAEHNTFYKDIIIPIGKTAELSRDIKIPWNRSRFQHLNRANFCTSISSWIACNQFMRGVNWVCPMEVAIRAINWIWAYNSFHQSVPNSFLPQFTGSLYDHMVYLENNWERYDGRTNNHYLSDLVGYLYLCWFFKDLSSTKKKTVWCYAELLKEFDKQIFAEGSSYEGSTAYHKLVTELLQHTLFICQKLELSVPAHVHTRYAAMHDFINWCSPTVGDMITIGDDDSGTIVNNSFSQTTAPQTGRKDFYEFGLSILKTAAIHLTLRHHAYQKHQPSGHFHNDAGSITLAVEGVPIFVDPGSYVYTASSIWRNYFRSITVHNTFFLVGHEPVPFDDRLFALAIPEYHTLYARFGLTAQRTVFTTNKEIIREITIEDVWLGDSKTQAQTGWNFTLAPTITVERTSRSILLVHNKKVLVQLTSPDLIFTITQGWYSPKYGTKVPTLQLRAYTKLEVNKKFVITLSY